MSGALDYAVAEFFFYICIFFCTFSVKISLFQSITEVTSKNSLFEPKGEVSSKNSRSQPKKKVSCKNSISQPTIGVSCKNSILENEVSGKKSFFQRQKKVGCKTYIFRTKGEVSSTNDISPPEEVSFQVLYKKFQVKDIHMLCFLFTYFSVCFILKLEKKMALCHQVIFVIPLS